jgi:hypothetical protein
MDVNKQGGGSSSDRQKLYQVACDQQKYITEKIRIIDPEIILLCLSFDRRVTSKLFGPLIWQRSGYSIEIASFGNAKIIDFYHPSARNVGVAAYSLLQNVVKSKTFRNLSTL